MNFPHRKIASTKRLVKNPWFAMLFTLLLIASSMTIIIQHTPTATAQSTCAGGNWSKLRWKSDSPNVKNGTYIGPSGFAEVEFDWQAKKEAKAGETIDFTLPQSSGQWILGLEPLKIKEAK